MWGPVSVGWAAWFRCWCDDMRVQFSLFERKAMTVWNSGRVDEVDPFRLWLLKFMWFHFSAWYEKGESPAPPLVFQLPYGVPHDSRLQRAEEAICGEMAPSAGHKSDSQGRHGATMLPVTPNRPKSFPSPVIQSWLLLSARTGNPFHTLGSFTLWMLEKQPFEQ